MADERQPPSAELLRDLQENERLARALIAVIERIRAHGRDLHFYAINHGEEGLAHWRQFLAREYGMTW